MNSKLLIDFVIESNAIEGINRAPTDTEIIAAEKFLELSVVDLEDLIDFVKVFQPDAKLRVEGGLNVRVGNHFPPMGGPAIGYALKDLLHEVNYLDISPHAAHVKFELLHPFTDGNGRSGRMIWLWMRKRELRRMPTLSFLHSFYYSTLDEARE